MLFWFYHPVLYWERGSSWIFFREIFLFILQEMLRTLGFDLGVETKNVLSYLKRRPRIQEKKLF